MYNYIYIIIHALLSNKHTDTLKCGFVNINKLKIVSRNTCEDG